MKRNLVLIGFMASGKSSVAKELQKRLKVKVWSTDALIEAEQGKTIAQIFEDSGEGYFRTLEHQAVIKAASHRGAVIDCGGGVVLNPENISILKQNGILIYLSSDPQAIYERIKVQKHRPLLKVPNPLETIQEMLQVRQPLYAQADYTFDTTHGDVKRVASEILQKVKI